MTTTPSARAIQRDQNMVDAILNLISEMGDMPIPISALWYERLIRRAGREVEIYDYADREVCAVALETLCVFAGRNIAIAIRENRP